MPTQRLLTPIEPPAPWPGSADHYVPALQSLPGELEALERAPTSIWEGMTPLIQVHGPKRSPTRKEPLRSQTVRGWIKDVAMAVGDHPVFLDRVRLKPCTPTLVGKRRIRPVLEIVYDAAFRRNLAFVPVVWLGASNVQERNLVGDAAARSGRGVGVRYRPRDFMPPTGSTIASLVDDTLDDIGCPIEQADLILDLKYIGEKDELEPEDVLFYLKEIAKAGPWRSMTFLGTAIPRSLGEVKEDTVGPIPRREWKLWCDVSQLKGAPVTSFGDYAVQHPDPPKEGGGGGIMRGNIRYTADEDFVISRGVSMLEEGAEQYVRLCDRLTNRSEWAGRSYTWADELIEDCAKGYEEPGGRHAWRGVGTAHHLRQVTDQLRKRAAS